MNISFIIPCLNCESFIERNIQKLQKKLKKMKKINYELIFINDGSKDKTGKILKKYSSNRIKVIQNGKNMGKSASLIRGVRASKKNNIVIIDCDLPYFKYLDFILKNLNRYRFIYINRKSKKSKLISKNLNLYQISRFFIGRIICLILNLFFFNSNTGDTQAGLKAFAKPKNLKINFISKGFLDAELMILFNKSNIKMLSVPVSYKFTLNLQLRFYLMKTLYIYMSLSK